MQKPLPESIKVDRFLHCFLNCIKTEDSDVHYPLFFRLILLLQLSLMELFIVVFESVYKSFSQFWADIYLDIYQRLIGLL